MAHTKPTSINKITKNKLTEILFSDEELDSLNELVLLHNIGFPVTLERIVDTIGNIPVKTHKGYGEPELCTKCVVKHMIHRTLRGNCGAMEECRNFEIAFNDLTYPEYFSIQNLYKLKRAGTKS